ncbi:MAG TPA: putative maltokinase [Mycobacteriales bacterium]|nr:putative maltokinase [Mycobacteriales bacterium]
MEQRTATEPRSEPVVVTGKWTECLRGDGRAPINRVLPSYLASRRWFRDKSRRIRSTSVVDIIEIPPAPGTGASAPGYVVVVDVQLDQGLPERYALAIGHATTDAAEEICKWRPDSVMCDIRSADGEGVLYDALTMAPFGKALLAAMARRRHLGGARGRLEAVPTRELRRLRDGIDAETPAVPISVEQSNTSVAIGNRLVVKVIRRLEEGINPDVEVSGFLTDTVRFPHAPKLGGSIEYRLDGDEPATLAVAQEFVANEGDGWSYVLDALSRVLEEVITHPAPEELRITTTSADPLSWADLVPPREHPLVGPHLHWAEVLGRRTAELHLSLASNDLDDAFAPEPFTAVDRRSLHHGAKSLLRRSLRAVRAMREPSECVQELLAREPEILARLETAMRTPISARKIRCHGDYHLGQVLWTGKDFMIIDFEGEPARPLSSRRLKRPPLVDVAGMIRSFHYASRVAGGRISRDLTLGDEQARLDPLTTLWYRSITGAFLRSYLACANDGKFLPTERDELSALLDFLLLEKAIYEVGYEADNRPAWVDVPARGVLDLLGGAS